MTTVHRPLVLSWCQPPALVPAAARLDQILTKWRGTPYVDQQPVPGPQGGVGCFGFVCAVLDALYGREGAEIPGLPGDTGLNNPERAKAAMRWFLERYNVERVGDGSIEPGDIVVVTLGKTGAPGHVMLVGPRKNALWHTLRRLGVHYGGLSLPAPSTYHSTYRCKDRELWLTN